MENLNESITGKVGVDLFSNTLGGEIGNCNDATLQSSIENMGAKKDVSTNSFLNDQ